MAAHNFKLDLSKANQLTIATSTSDNSVVIPKQRKLNINAPASTGSAGSWWVITVAGAPVWVNINAAADNSGGCALLPVGQMAMPYFLTPGETVHALATFGTGQVTLTPAFINYQ